MQMKARAIGYNHVALIVGDIDEALAFYGRLFDFTLRAPRAAIPHFPLSSRASSPRVRASRGPRINSAARPGTHAN